LPGGIRRPENSAEIVDGAEARVHAPLGSVDSARYRVTTPSFRAFSDRDLPPASDRETRRLNVSVVRDNDYYIIRDARPKRKADFRSLFRV